MITLGVTWFLNFTWNLKCHRFTSQSLLLAGVLRGLWESDPEADLRGLDIYLPDQSLMKSFRSPPASFSNEVVECLSEAAHLT